MSQYPPQGNPPQGPYGNPPGYGQPAYAVPGYPPQGQYSLPPATKTSAAAITSLVCGVVGCIPFVTSITAVVTGFVGLSATNNPNVKGRGLAIAGLILGLVGIVGWSGISVAAVVGFRKTLPQRMMTRQFISNLATGNVDAAAANCTPNISHDTLQNTSNQLTQYGGIQKINIFGVNVSNINGVISENITAEVYFNNGQHHTIIVTLLKNGTAWKVDSISVN